VLDEVDRLDRRCISHSSTLDTRADRPRPISDDFGPGGPH
jgi:hypothetical protein